MSQVTQIVGFALWLAALAAFWHAYAGRRKLPPALIAPGYLALLPLAFLLRGMLGDASLALPALCHLAGGGAPMTRKGRLLLGFLAIVTLALAVSALGLIATDLYASGYAPGLLVVIVACGVAAAYRWLPVLGWSWLLGLGLSAAGLHPSPNLWDALVDLPSLVLAAVILVRTRAAKLQSG